MLKKYFRSLEEINASEWLLCLLISLITGILSLAARDDEENPNLTPIFAGQSIYYLFRTLIPVFAFLRDRVGKECPEETVTE